MNKPKVSVAGLIAAPFVFVAVFTVLNPFFVVYVWWVYG